MGEASASRCLELFQRVLGAAQSQTIGGVTRILVHVCTCSQQKPTRKQLPLGEPTHVDVAIRLESVGTPQHAPTNLDLDGWITLKNGWWTQIPMQTVPTTRIPIKSHSRSHNPLSELANLLLHFRFTPKNEPPGRFSSGKR